jgi:hypothetical protein
MTYIITFPLEFISTEITFHTIYKFAAYGVAYVTFQIDVGTVTGSHNIEVRINWVNKGIETNPNNNSVSKIINVKKDEYAFGIEVVTPNTDYTRASPS